MKKVFAIAVIAATLTACSEGNTDTTAQTPLDDNSMATAPTYSPSEGDVKVVDGHLMVYDNGSWEKAEHDITLDDGTVVTVNGTARRENGTEIEVKDGNVISKTGQWFDKAGHSISNAWDATKEGIKDGADAVKKGAEKVGEETKDLFDGKKDN